MPVGAGDADGLRAQILASDRELNDVLNRLESTRNGRLIPALLSELGLVLDRHFAHEEASQGLFAIIVAHAPAHAEACRQLRSEHWHLRTNLSALVDEAGASLVDVPLLEASLGLARRLRDHERREKGLLVRALAHSANVARSPPRD
ncbi:MAG: hemerythrin domain-containing protein [Planctomycetota bacterium]